MTVGGALLAALCVGITALPASAAAPDACEALRARYGRNNLTLVGSLALAARHAAPGDQDLRCLEQIWLGRDGGMGEEATRTLLAIASRHAHVVVRAASARPGVYRAWMDEWKAYGIADYTGQEKMVREARRQLRTVRPRGPDETAGHRLLLDGFQAVKVFKVD